MNRPRLGVAVVDIVSSWGHYECNWYAVELAWVGYALFLLSFFSFFFPSFIIMILFLCVLVLPSLLPFPYRPFFSFSSLILTFLGCDVVVGRTRY